jgi:hypothetical protein
MKPAVTGLTLLPLTATTRSPSTRTSRLQASGQSSGQTLGRIVEGITEAIPGL